MQHPFITDLSDKTMEELQEAISSITSKLTFSYRTRNQPLISQLSMALDSYRAEYGRRMDEMYSKQNYTNQIKINK